MAKLLVITLSLIVILLALDRSFYCACGEFRIWIGDTYSSHNSQHIFDCYSFSHFQHGLIFYLFLWYFFRKPKLEYAIIIEAFWEILENTPFIINRYRSETSALGYSGDTITNSIFDLVSCGLGFYVASKINWKISLAIYIAIELVMIALIKDSLLINVLMLIYPIEAIKHWQLQ